MKALSIRQPWAELILRGDKTLDLRTWQVHYRGPLLIHASNTRRPRQVQAMGLDPTALDYGALVGQVELVEIIPLDRDTYEATRDQHRSPDPFPGGPLYGWRLAHPHRLPRPIPYRGRMGLFQVPDDLTASTPSPAEPSVRRATTGSTPSEEPPVPPDLEHPFVLYTRPEPGSGYSAVLTQWWHGNGGESAPGERSRAAITWQPLWRIEVGSDTVRAVADLLIATLQANGYRATDLSRQMGKPFFLTEPHGLRLALTLLAIKPVSRYDRIEAMVNGIRAMSDEEAYYWFSKCSNGPTASRAQRALRILLAAE